MSKKCIERKLTDCQSLSVRDNALDMNTKTTKAHCDLYGFRFHNINNGHTSMHDARKAGNKSRPGKNQTDQTPWKNPGAVNRKRYQIKLHSNHKNIATTILQQGMAVVHARRSPYARQILKMLTTFENRQELGAKGDKIRAKEELSGHKY